MGSMEPTYVCSAASHSLCWVVGKGGPPEAQRFDHSQLVGCVRRIEGRALVGGSVSLGL